MQIFNFIVSSVIIARHSVLSPRISKIHLPISSLNVRELKLEAPYVRDGSPTPTTKP